MPMVTGVRRDQRPKGKGSKGRGPDGQCKASINPAAARQSVRSYLARQCEAKAIWLLGPSVAPMVLFVVRD